MTSRTTTLVRAALRPLLLLLAVLAHPVTSSANSTVGAWSPVYSWPCVAIHLHLLPDGRILCYADDDNPNYPVNGARLAGSTKAFLVEIPIDGTPGTVTAVPNERTNMFCSGHTHVADGRLLVVGGHLGKDGWGEPRTEFFDYRNPTAWFVNHDMLYGRWYPSACILSNGDLLAIAGTKDSVSVQSTIPEVWSPSNPSGWRQLTNASRTLPYYPFTFLAPNGRVFVAGPHVDSRYLNTTGLGTWQFVANHVLNRTRSYGSAVQYDDGKILVVGGDDPPTTTCEIIDINQPSPAWQNTGALANARRQLNTTVLPDGTVLATGGTSGTGFNNNNGAVLAAELWDPAANDNLGAWSTMASMTVRRLYHSTTALLPDGRVLSAGSGRPKASNGGADQLNAEIYSPPYLFKGARPVITSAPDFVNNGAAFTIITPSALNIAQVTMVRLSSTTHAFNMGQRFNRLTFAASSGSIQATMPASTSLVPPGFYMLFILNGTGVPSLAKMIRVGPPGPVAVEETPGSELLDFIALRSANPSHGSARIAFTVSRSEAGRVEVLDVAGRRVKLVLDGYFDAGREQVVTWDGTDDAGAPVKSGLYWYRLQTASVTRTGKLALLAR